MDHVASLRASRISREDVVLPVSITVSSTARRSNYSIGACTEPAKTRTASNETRAITAANHLSTASTVLNPAP